MLLAAGRSTRLGPLGTELPKPLVPVCGYPAIRFGIEACRRAGVTDLVVNLFHHGDKIREELGDGSALGVSMTYSTEQQLLGTGGGLANARRLLGTGPVLVLNAKVVADVDLAAVLDAHRASGAIATMVLRADPDPGRWGAITTDQTGRVVGILDARAPGSVVNPVTRRMFTGMHVVEPALFDDLPAAAGDGRGGGVSDVIRDAYIPALRAGRRIVAVDLPGYFAEHSTPERYLASNLALLASPSLLPVPPGALTGVEAGAAVAASAVVAPPVRVAPRGIIEAGAVVGPLVVVCSGARVAAGARVRRAVVWPGAVATGEVQDAIVTRGGIMQIAA